MNVASDAHKGVSIDFDDIEGKKRFGGWRAYQQSKLANILFTYELARRLEGKRVTANALHPGFVRTTIFRERGLMGWLLAPRRRCDRPFAGRRGQDVGLSRIVARRRRASPAGISSRKSRRKARRNRDDPAAARAAAGKLSEEMTGTAQRLSR